MAASDGGHVWIPRASDPRIQELVGTTPFTPDAVFKALRALGKTGSLDDMWFAHLADLGITDTSEPFTESLLLVDNYLLESGDNLLKEDGSLYVLEA